MYQLLKLNLRGRGGELFWWVLFLNECCDGVAGVVIPEGPQKWGTKHHYATEGGWVAE